MPRQRAHPVRELLRALAYANEHRPWQLYRAVFQELLGRGQAVAPGRTKFRFKNKLVSLDSTVIDLCATLFDWAKFRRPKGAVKLHCLLDPDGYLPSVGVTPRASGLTCAWPAPCAWTRARSSSWTAAMSTTPGLGS